MITNALIQILLLPIKLLLAIFPVVEEIPYVDDFLVLGFGYFRTMAEFFPPFETLLVGFVAWLGIKSIFLVARFFLGNRLPISF